VRAEREARRVARAQRLAEGPSTAALALRKAQRWQQEIGSRGLRRADIARAEGITRARVTQVMGLLALPADLQRDLTDNKPYTRSWSVGHALEMAAVSEWEREAIGERTSAALQHKKRLGQYTGGPVPYGDLQASGRG